MDPSQQESRQAAAEAFMESLDQLEQSLQAGEGDASRANLAGDRLVKPPQVADGDRIEVEALAAAAADIEQFMQTKYSDLGEKPEDDRLA